MRGRPHYRYDVPDMKLLRWEEIPLEQLTPLLARQVIHGANVTVGLIHLEKGCVVPEHKHVHEQLSLVLEGRLRFLGPGIDVAVEPGGIVHLAPEEPHSVEALENSLVMDTFAPAREDWRSGKDAYLRAGTR